MTDVQAAFLTYAARDRRRSPHTMRRYREVLSNLSAFCDPETATMEQVEMWWQSRYDLSAATQAADLACLRSFYRWMTRFDHRPDDPTRRLDAPKVNVKMPRPIGKADVERLMGAITAEHLPLRRTFALGIYGGLRISEAAALDWADVNAESRRIYITGKGNKERAMGISTELLDLLLPQVAGNVVTAGEKPYSGDRLQRLANRFLERHDINHTFHDLRKRGATMAISKGASHVAIMRAFGWSSIQTVAHYAAVGDEELDAIARMMV